MDKVTFFVAGLLALTMSNATKANDVKIVAAEFRGGGVMWSVNVTLKHNDTGWDHYADNWRVVDGDGKVLGDRVLFHPHVNEQPFTRSLTGVTIPEGVKTVYIEAHDKKHGWTAKRLTIDLSKVSKRRLRVEAK